MPTHTKERDYVIATPIQLQTVEEKSSGHDKNLSVKTKNSTKQLGTDVGLILPCSYLPPFHVFQTVSMFIEKRLLLLIF